jgi:hypothetical protein
MSIACDAPWLAGWVMREENLFSWVFVDAVIALSVENGPLRTGKTWCNGAAIVSGLRRLNHQGGETTKARGSRGCGSRLRNG